MFRWGKMRSFFLSDEELGKKDDDHKKPVKNVGRRPSSSWQAARIPPRRSLKRIAIAFVVVALVYLFVHNIPVLGPNHRMRRPIYLSSQPEYRGSRQLSEDEMRLSRSAAHGLTKAVDAAERTFNGPFRFNNLAISLQAVSNLWGDRSQTNKNVVFAVASLKSAATLLPMACQMGSELKNYVHFVLFGGSSISLELLRAINGIDKSCAIFYHDARPDYATVSTVERLEKTVVRGLYHINAYLRPSIILLDGSDDEDDYMTRGVKQHVKLSKTTLIELPPMALRSLSWVTRLDIAALQTWNKIKFDILIQATSRSSGSLIRLLRSLSAADYTSSTIPRITIELPHHIDQSTKKFLDSFMWPPSHIHNPTNERYLTLRHRIYRRKLTEEEASARFLESFWPTDSQSHVLVLSPNAEVSQQYFHYLKYSLLEYYYSTTATSLHWGQYLFGISLEQPLDTLDGKRSISPPLFKPPEDINNQIGGTPNPFLWQAPTSNAVLFLGDKWMELHDFVSRTMQATENLDDPPAIVSEKVVSKQYPSWLEHALRLARVRGYYFLYPGNEVAEHLATVHGEMYSVPEEYTGEKGSRESLSGDDAGYKQIQTLKQKARMAPETHLSSLYLQDSLPNKGYLWPLSALPIMVWEGNEMASQDFRKQAEDFELAFKEQVGGCDRESGKREGYREPASARDLFCNVP
ncbi:hypothetical protein GGS21DRAFT_240458 [Xylaria nigripes]|nr:hypothetical protein GGS21DRAFT_240458 [Xylaria nigripes]